MGITDITRNGLRIQYASGFCLKKGIPAPKSWQPYLKPVAPVLALLGDIGHASCPSVRTFFNWSTENYEEIIWVPGLTEFQGPASWSEQIDTMFSLQRRYKNLCIGLKLNISPYNLLATPLWMFNPHITLSTSNKSHPMSLERIQDTFLEETWLQKYIRLNDSKRVTSVIISYGPSIHKMQKVQKPIIHLSAFNKNLVNSSGYVSPMVWMSQNDMRYKGYRNDAVIEISDNETSFSISKQQEHDIMRQLTNPESN